MPIISYGLDREVFTRLEKGKDNLDKWKGKASGISDYVASWGLVRFWSLSHSKQVSGGKTSSEPKADSEYSYFAWSVARKVLCTIITDRNLGITERMTTNDFQKKFYELDINNQVLLAELLIEIADTIQFWTMRFSDINENRK